MEIKVYNIYRINYHEDIGLLFDLVETYKEAYDAINYCNNLIKRNNTLNSYVFYNTRDNAQEEININYKDLNIIEAGAYFIIEKIIVK